MVYKTGDICYVKFSPAHGSLLGGVRPAYILREFPEIGVVTVAPITTIQSGGNPSWRIPLLAGQCGMSVESTICLDMMRAVPVDQVDWKICEAPDQIRALVDGSIFSTFCIGG